MLLAADSGNSVSDIALFAGVIGVAVGWFLGEISRVVRWWFQQAAATKAEQQARVINFLQSAESVAAQASSLAYAQAATASGNKLNRDQLMSLTNSFNEESGRLDRLGLEIRILGPDWSIELATACVNRGRTLTDKMNDVERSPNVTTLQAVIDELDELAEERQKLTDLAVKSYA